MMAFISSKSTSTNKNVDGTDVGRDILDALYLESTESTMPWSAQDIASKRVNDENSLFLVLESDTLDEGLSHSM